MRQRSKDWVVALFLCVCTTAIAFQAGKTEGVNRDEAFYFDAAEQHWGWFGELGDNLVAGHPQRSFTRASVDHWFSYNHEHPALMKTLYGISWRLFHRCECPRFANRHAVASRTRHRTLGLMSDAEAMRFPADLMAGLLAALVYLFGARAGNRRVGLVAAVLAVAAPRYFFHAEVACFDAPVATTWLATVYAYWRALDDKKWRWRTGLCFGLALATKHNGFFLPFVLGAHWLWVERARLLRLGRALVARTALPPPSERPRAWQIFVWMAILGPAVELAVWPWLWFDTVARLREYFAFHLHHVYYNIEYLGTNWNKPPFPKSYPFVMTLLTAPVTTLALAAVGAAAFVGAAWRRRAARATSGEGAFDAVAPGARQVADGAPAATPGASTHAGNDAVAPGARQVADGAPAATPGPSTHAGNDAVASNDSEASVPSQTASSGGAAPARNDAGASNPGERAAREGSAPAAPLPGPDRRENDAIASHVTRAEAASGSGAPAARAADPSPWLADRNATGLLVGINVFVPPAIIAFTGAPIFGATKHWLAAIPFLALLAGVGFDALAQQAIGALRLSRRGALVAALVGGVVACAPAVAETWRSHPYALTHYNLLAGGPAGGADLGMNRQFWGYATRGVLPWLDAHARPGAAVYWHDAHQGMLNIDVREHLLREDIGNTGLEEPGVRAADIAMVVHEKHFDKYEYWIWDFFHTTRPAYVLTDEGVPIVTVYDRDATSARR